MSFAMTSEDDDIENARTSWRLACRKCQVFAAVARLVGVCRDPFPHGSTRRTLRHPAIAFDLRLTDEPVSADLDCEQLPSVDLSPKGVVGDADLPTRLVKRHQFHKR